MHGHLDALPVAVRPILSLSAAERGHAVLTVEHSLVVQALRAASSVLDPKGDQLRPASG